MAGFRPHKSEFGTFIFGTHRYVASQSSSGSRLRNRRHGNAFKATRANLAPKPQMYGLAEIHVYDYISLR